MGKESIMNANLSTGVNGISELSADEMEIVAGGFGQMIIGFLVKQSIKSLVSGEDSVFDQAKRHAQSKKGQKH
jgi:hypothetical protein